MRKEDDEGLSHRRRRSAIRRAWTYSPSGEVEAAPPPEPTERREERERRLQAHLAHQESLQREFGPYFEIKAREILAGREATIDTTAGVVRARLIRFRNGAVLEVDRFSPRATGHGGSRIERQALNDPVPLVVRYLIQAVLALGPDAHPID